MFSKFAPAAAGTALIAIAAACSQGSGEASAQGAMRAADVTIEAIEPVRAEPIDEQLVTCSHTSENGNTSTNFFVLTEGMAKSYSSFQNFARNLCDPGQPDCAQGWIGDNIASYSVNRRGYRNQHLVDLDTMTMERALTDADGTVETSQYQCTSEALPVGIRIE